MSALLEVEDLAFVSRRARELEDVTFELARGEAVAVIADNGVAKTLLLRLLCGLERPSEGRIRIDGRNVHACREKCWRAVRRGMGVALDGAGLLPHLTLAENIAYPLLVRGESMRQCESSLEFALAYFDLYRWRAEWPHDLPADVVKRALLARASIASPSLLLCDNPFEDQDDQARRSIGLALARQVANRDLALLFTSSRETDAALVGARVLRLG